MRTAFAKGRGLRLIATYIVAGIILIIVVGLTIWVTGKAYSRKWEDE